ncbi:MAG: OmpA family protein [Candidatus Solibacter sp.]
MALITSNKLRAAIAGLLLLTAGCATKQPSAPAPVAPVAPPQPPQSVVVLMPDPGGKPSSITLTNSAGSQTLTQPYQALRVARADTAPAPPITMERADVQRVFGAALDTLPKPEVAFTLHFSENSDVLLPESQALLPAIMSAIRERRSTAISVIGHTDTTADPQFNYRLGVRRADGVAKLFLAQGLNESNLFVESHGDADLLVKTGRDVANAQNRRVEVIVR